MLTPNLVSAQLVGLGACWSLDRPGHGELGNKPAGHHRAGSAACFIAVHQYNNLSKVRLQQLVFAGKNAPHKGDNARSSRCESRGADRDADPAHRNFRPKRVAG